MTSPTEAIELIREAKRKKGLTWEQIAAHVGRSPVYITSACLRENSLGSEDAKKLGALLDLAPDIVALLQSCPKKGSRSLDIPKDPLIYRFHEINLVYGDTLKGVDSREIWGRDHERDRFHHGSGESRRPQGRSGQGHDVRQIFAISEMVAQSGRDELLLVRFLSWPRLA